MLKHLVLSARFKALICAFVTSPESHYSEQKWLSYIEIFTKACMDDTLGNYSRLCLNPYLSVDTKKYGLLQSMGFGRACPRPLFSVVQVLYYALDDYVRLNATN